MVTKRVPEHSLENHKLGGWRDGTTVKTAYLSCRKPKLSPWHPLQVAPDPGDLMPSLHVHTQINTNLQKENESEGAHK